MQNNIAADNKRIARNTILLYLRTIFMMFIGLFTSRVILNALGVSDLGLMNVASSVITMFTFLNGTLSSGTQRFLSFGLGESNTEKLKRVFANAMTLHLALAVVIFILGETVGLWYVYNHLNVEEGRFTAAMWCYQLSIVSTMITLVQVPFNSALIAHEKMDIYAYMSIFDAAFKLLAAYLIMIVPMDRVILYSLLIFGFNIVTTYIYNWYCRRHFEECSFSFGYDKSLFREMLSFSGWNTIGCLAGMGQGTGVNLIINAFCGTAVNGARGIALQASSWVTRFVDTFQTAVNPQITKSYASQQYDRTGSLVCNGAKYACFLFLVLGIPLFIEIEWVMQIWLGQCPDYAVAFMRISMLETFFRTIGNPTITAMHATGKMKEVNLTVAVILLMIVPVSYVLFKLGFSPEFVLLANVIPWAIVPFIRIHWVNKFSDNKFPVKRFVFGVYFKTLFLAALMFIPPYLVFSFTCEMKGIVHFLFVGVSSVITSFLVLYFIGLDKSMRLQVKEKTVQFIKNKIKH